MGVLEYGRENQEEWLGKRSRQWVGYVDLVSSTLWNIRYSKGKFKRL